MEVLVFVIIIISFFYLAKAITVIKKDRKIKKTRKAIENAGKLLGTENMVHDLLYKGICEIGFSLNCRELNDLNIDQVIKSLSPHLVNDINGFFPTNDTLAIWLLLGLCHIRKKDFNKAIDLLTKLGKPTELWVAYCHTELKEYYKAINILQDLPDENINSKLLLSICFIELEEYKFALTVLKKVIRKRKLFNNSPNKLKILSVLGEIYEKKDDYAQALKCYEQIYVENISFDIGDGINILEKINSLKDKGLNGKKRFHISQKVREGVWRRDQGRCVECGSQRNIEFDHIIPVSKGGSNTNRNIRLLCEDCNRKKSDNI